MNTNKSIQDDTQSLQSCVSVSVTASELRIGNIVRLLTGDEEFYEIRSFDDEVMSFKGHISFDYIGFDEIESIPLTEEWVKKLGFEEYYSSRYRKNYDLPNDPKFGFGFNLVNDIAMKGFSFKGNYDFEHIKYVHQLQNLYFALTGLELQLLV